MTYYKGSSLLDGIFKGTVQYLGIATVLLIVLGMKESLKSAALLSRFLDIYKVLLLFGV